jgi:hypothetical protein
VPFWLWPNSSFGQSIVIQVQTAVQLTYPYRTSLAPQPPFCWQSPRRTLTSTARRVSGGTLSAGLHTIPLPGSHASVGYCQPHGRFRHPIPLGLKRNKVGSELSLMVHFRCSKPTDREFPDRNRWDLVAKTQQIDRFEAPPKGSTTVIGPAFSLWLAPSKLGSNDLTVGRCARGKPPFFRESSKLNVVAWTTPPGGGPSDTCRTDQTIVAAAPPGTPQGRPWPTSTNSRAPALKPRCPG